MVKIFVGGLSSETSEMDLVMFISLHGQVVTIKIVRDKVTRKSKGYAFLEMANQEEADKAVAALNGATFKGNELTVRVAAETPPKAPVYKKVGPPSAAPGLRPRRPRK
ncbi:RNA binding protein [Pedobacter sp. BAL39]|uniref:RNA recognition motif domain-containing protein n=1 Tax=Pedobacter sp. BAL39 TaxID=391596 RepID=UPI00015596D5|nr:RNA-binding protein [Pedobacter sp. BAL39]EDM37702.1 RNA binding protein [Pedobacter sp. BAL39]